jgi:predicted N-acetyltransferase YhbS
VIAMAPLARIDSQAVEALLDRAFGTDRHARTAYRVRRGTAPVPELSFAATLEDGSLAGAIQCWPVALECDSGESVPMVMVGPVAVEPSLQQGGIGRALMDHMLAAVASAPVPGADALMLIGDPEYYGRFFGFVADKTGGWRLPGPFEARRLLARGDAVPDRSGEVGPRIGAPA